jgi:membrane-associated phospholipid phosphatase
MRPKLAAVAAGMAAIVALIANSVLGYGLVLLLGAGAVGIDRVFVGVHYPLDVATSVAIGFVSAFVVTRFRAKPDGTSGDVVEQGF